MASPYANESGLMRVAMLTPDEQQQNIGYETSPEVQGQFLTAIQRERDPQKRAMLAQSYQSDFGEPPPGMPQQSGLWNAGAGPQAIQLPRINYGDLTDLDAIFGAIKKPDTEGAFARAGRVLGDPDGGVLPAVGSLMKSAVPNFDTAIDIARAPITLSQTIAGVGNLATGGLLGKGLDAIGYDPKAASDFLSEGYSEGRKKAQQKVAESAQQMEQDVSDASGAYDTAAAGFKGAGKLVGTLLQNPSVIQEQVIRTLPDMLFGAGLMGKIGKTIFLGAAETAGIDSARAVELMSGVAPANVAEKAAIEAGQKAIKLSETKLSWLGHGVEGAQAAGQNAWQIREDDPNNIAGQYLQIPAGIITAMIGRAASKIPGFGDVQTAAQMAIAGPKAAGGVLGATGSFGKRVGKGFLNEGLFQEFPQSYQEQVWQNIAQGKPWNEGALTQGVEGAVVGGLMGAGEGAISKPHVPDVAQPAPGAAPTTEDLQQPGGPGPADPSVGQPSSQALPGDPNALEGEYLPAGQEYRQPNESLPAPDQQPGAPLLPEGTPQRDVFGADNLLTAPQPMEGDVYGSDQLPPGQALLPAPAIDGQSAQVQDATILPSAEVGGPTDRQLSISRGLLNHSPQASPDLLMRLMGADQTMATMLFNQWQASKSPPTPPIQPATTPAPAGVSTSGDQNAAQADQALKGEQEKTQQAAQAVTSLDAQAHAAATSPFNATPQPTDGQKEAGNYKLGHVTVQGLPISIENPAGSVRSGTDASGKPWQTEMKHHYGYLKGTVGSDKDHLDVFLGPQAEASPTAYVVDQVNPGTGKFDEHKIVLGANSAQEASDIYHANYQDGWKGMGAITAMPMPEFKDWIKSGNTKKPLGLATPNVVPATPNVADPLQVKYAAAQAAGDTNEMRRLAHEINQAKAQKPAQPKAPKQETADAPFGKVGMMPNTAQPVSLQDHGDGTATIMRGDEPFYDFENGDPVKVAAGATPVQVRQAITDAQALTSKEKWFGVKAEAAPKATTEQSSAVAPVIAGKPVSEISTPMLEQIAASSQPAAEKAKAEVDRRSNTFVSAPDGSLYFGEITPGLGKKIRREAAKIHLTETGRQHIQTRHGKELLDLGYSSVEHFVEEVGKNFNVIAQPENTRQIILGKVNGRDKILFVQLEPNADNTAYLVTGGYDSTRDVFNRRVESNKWKLLWDARASASSSTGEGIPFVEPHTVAGHEATNAPGQSSGSSIAQPPSTDKIAGKPVSEISDAMLAQVASSTQPAATKARTEVARRAAAAEPEALPAGWTQGETMDGRPSYTYRPNGLEGHWTTVAHIRGTGHKVAHYSGPDLKSTEEYSGSRSQILWEAKKHVDELTAKHIEGGKSEPATAAVIASSMKKSANHTPMDIKQAREWLLNAVDGAILEAKSAKDEGYWNSADQKVKLEGVMNIEKDIGYKIFDVPGDGKFKILNLKESLQNFKKKVSASPGFKGAKGSPMSTATGIGKTSVRDMLDEGELLLAVDYGRQIGKPMLFGAVAKEKDAPVAYTDGEDAEIKGINAKVGRVWSQKEKSSGWRVIEMTTGLGMGVGESSKERAVLKAEESIKERGIENVQALISKGAKTPQAELEKQWTDWAAEQEKKEQDSRDSEYESARADNELWNELFPLKQGEERGPEPWRNVHVSAIPGVMEDAIKAGKGEELARLFERSTALNSQQAIAARMALADAKAKFGEPKERSPEVGTSRKDNDRDRFTLERLNRETDKMEKVSFKRGEYVTIFMNTGGSFKGEIEGISQANKEAKVDGLWYDFGRIYKAERPAPEVKPTVPLSKAIDNINTKNGDGLTEADRVPGTGGSTVSSVEAHGEFFNRVYSGKVTADEFKAAFKSLADNKPDIVAELSAMTKPAIFGQFPGIEYRYKSDKKAVVVQAAYNQMLVKFSLGEGVSYGMSNGSYKNALQKIVDLTTEEKLAEFAKEVKVSTEERLAQREEAEAGMDNPKTLDDFKRILTAKAHDLGEGATFTQARMAMTPEHRAKFDELAAEVTRGDRLARKESQQESSIRAPGEVVATTEIIKTRHTKHGHDLWQFAMEQRVSPEEFKSLVSQAKRLGGDYSSYRGNGAIPGWQFRTEEAARAFKALVAGDATEAKGVMQARRDAFSDDRSQTAFERLNEMADSLDERADESLNRDRKSNTSRRAGMAARAESAANADKALAQTMRNISTAIQDGTAKFLDRIRQKAQVEMLWSMLRSAQRDELTKKYESYAEQERHQGQAPTAETADYAKFPYFTADRSDLARLAREMEQIDGAKKLGQRLLKVADDVTGPYQKFAKENLHKVSTFSVSGGGSAVFGTRDAAEAAIKRSGLKGKAAVVSFKRGEHLVIMGPQMAKEKGIWAGDGDKRITIDAGLADEIVASNKAFGRSNRLSMPYIFDIVSRDRARLKGMGIETPAELRAALREFIDLRQKPAEPDRIKQLEREMVGRKNDGLDFFPTSEAVAKDMIDAADIKEGMTVLEPSAGMGHIAEQIRDAGAEPDVVEMASDRKDLLEAKGFNVVGRDFMDMSPRGLTYGDTFKDKDGVEGVLGSNGGLGSSRYKFIVNGDERNFRWVDREDLTGVRKNGTNSGYDRIIMNPPFSDRRDAEHVQHAYTLLRPGGRLVAIMGEGVFFGQDKRAQEFRDWLDSVGGSSEKLEAGSFMDPSLPVNTGVNARMVVIDRPGNQSGETIPAYSRGESGSASVSEVEQAAKEITDGMANAAPVEVVQSVSDLPFDAPDDILGVYWGGRVWLVADNLGPVVRRGDPVTLRESVASTIAHEMIAHYGLRGFFGDALNTVLREIHKNNLRVQVAALKWKNANTKVIAEWKAKYGMTDEQVKYRSIEEALAEMAGRGEKQTFWKRLAEGIQKALRAMGMEKMANALESRTDAEALAALRKAEMFVRKGIPSAETSGQAPLYSRSHVSGDSGRQYTPDQQKTFSNIGRVVETPTFKERVSSMWKDIGKRLEQGIADQFAPLKDLGGDAYLLSRLSRGADGALEAMLMYGKVFLRDGVYDVNAKDGGVIDKLLRPLGAEADDFMWWVAGNRADTLTKESAAARAEGARLLNQADVLNYQAKQTEAQAKQLFQQAGNFSKGMLGNQRMQKANTQQAEQLMREAKKMRAAAADAKSKGQDLAGVSRENLMSEEDIKNLLDLAKGDLNFDYTLPNGQTTRDRATAFAAANKIFSEFNKSVLDMAEESGLIDGDARAVWERDFYVPFYRDMEGDKPKFPNVKSGLVRQKAFERLKGGTEKLHSDLLANTILNWSHMLNAAAKNRAATASLKAAEQVGAAERISSSEKGSVSFKEGGNDIHYQVSDPFILDAITALEFSGFSGGAMKAMGAFKRWLTIGVTANPAFKIRNLIRDSISAIGTAEMSYNPIKNLKEGYQSTNKDSQTYASMLASGGHIRFGSMIEGHRADYVRRLAEKGVDPSTILDSESKWKAMWNRKIMPMWDAYTELGDRSENISRAAIYDQLRAKGIGHAEASLQARDLMDFSMGGTWAAVRFLTQVVPFTNARIQGLYKLGRSAKTDPRRFAYVTGAVALASLALLAAYHDDDDWKKREDWDRDNYWWFKVGGVAMRIPKPFEIGSIGTLAERSAELLFDKEMDGHRFGQRLSSMVGNTFSMNPMPQLLKPLYEVGANTDGFTGRPIESMGMERLRPEDRFNARSSEIAKVIGKAGMLSPLQIDHLIRGYFGWLGTAAVTSVDSLVRLADDTPRPAMQLRDTFLAGNFVETLPSGSSRYVSQMYEQAKDIDEAYNSWRHYLKSGDKATADSIFADNKDKIARYHAVENVKKAETAMNERAKQIESNKTMSSDDKRLGLDQLSAQKDRLARSISAARP